MKAALLLSATIAAIWPMTACAELSNEPLLGPGLRSRPAYDGSTAQRSELVPVLRYFGPSAFARSTQGVFEGGLRVELAPGFYAATQLAYEPGRRSSESDFLTSHAAPDIGRGASVGVQLEWDHQFGPMPVTLLARARQHTRSALGAQFDTRLSAGVFKSGAVSAGVFTQATWANAKSANAFYGVNAPPSVASGIGPFIASGGLLFASVGLLGSIDLRPQWVLVGSLEGRRLHGSAAQSPLAQRLWNHYASAGLAYRF